MGKVQAGIADGHYAGGGRERRHLWPSILPAAFFGAFFVYVWLWIDPSVIYHGVGLVHFPVFSWSRRFLWESIAHPGGPIEYLSALLSQCYYVPWAGALILTAIAACLGLALAAYVAAVLGEPRAPRPRIVSALRFFPAIFIIALLNQYAHSLGLLLALLACLAAVCAYSRAMRLGTLARVAAFVASSAALYYLAGGAYMLYAALCGIAELRRAEGPLLGLCYLLAGEALPYVFGKWLLGMSLTEALARLLPFSAGAEEPGQAIVAALYLFVLLSGVAGATWPSVARLLRRSEGRPRKSKAGAQKETRQGRLREGLGRVTANPAGLLAVPFVVAVATALLSYDSSRRRTLRINALAAREMWPEVLREARGLPLDRETSAVVPIINRALYETGRLPYDMFAYPQHPTLFMVGLAIRGRTAPELYRARMAAYFQTGDMDLQLGLVNAAEHQAHEALENLGEYPEVLKQLALVDIVKGQSEAARVFLNALSKRMHYRRWARDALRRLEADPTWSRDPEVRRIRELMIRDRSVILSMSVERRLQELLRTNRRNRMAFEYEMAAYLVARDLDDFVAELHRLDDFDYPGIPRLYEEAIVVYENTYGKKVDLNGRQVSAQTRRAYDDFLRAFMPYYVRGDRQAARDALKARFGNTFFFYFSFGESGVGSR